MHRDLADEKVVHSIEVKRLGCCILDPGYKGKASDA